MTTFYAGIELGGTKTICVIGNLESGVEHTLRVPTTTPNAMFEAVIPFLKEHSFKALGIASFGPINVNPNSRNYGEIENTPKPGWMGVNLREVLMSEFNCPMNIDTDVNGAALAEWQLGAGQGLDNITYVTVGTGIGGGTVSQGNIIHGFSHPEVGHIALPRVAGDTDFESSCRYHKSCAEGLASGTAIKNRWGAPLNEWPEDHDAWKFEAQYLAQLAHSLSLSYSPEKIIFGGGVSSEALLQRVRNYLHEYLNGYIARLNSRELLDDYISLPELGDNAGPMGALLLARDALPNAQSH